MVYRKLNGRTTSIWDEAEIPMVERCIFKVKNSRKLVEERRAAEEKFKRGLEEKAEEEYDNLPWYKKLFAA